MKTILTAGALVLALAGAAAATNSPTASAQRVLDSHGFDSVSAESLSTNQLAAIASVDVSADLPEIAIRAQIKSILN